jgi:hypothetical protein
MNHNVFFTHSSALGLNDDDVNSTVVLPAYLVLEFLKKPQGDPADFNAGWALRRHEEATKALEELGGAMVEVTGAGVVVGEYRVRPFLIGQEDFRALQEYWAHMRARKWALADKAV